MSRRWKSYRLRSLVIIVAYLYISLNLPFAAGKTLQSGKPIPVAANGGTGPLATPESYRTDPIGWAYVFGGDRPDLFVNAPRGVSHAFYIYKWVRDTEEGIPVFAPPVRVWHPFGKGDVPEGTVVEDSEGQILGFWINGSQLVCTLFDRGGLKFRKTTTVELEGLPRSPHAITLLSYAPDSIKFVVSCPNGARYRPPGRRNSDDYRLYDATGRYLGEWTYGELYRFSLSSDLEEMVALAEPYSTTNAIRLRASLATVRLLPDHPPQVIAASALGNFYTYPPGTNQKKVPVCGPELQTLRHPTMGATAISYPSKHGRMTDLIVGGEGALYYYRFTGEFDNGLQPVYENPTEVMQEGATLYAGSLAVPNVVDWDGDQVADIVAGNSEGRVLFFRNRGSNREPRFDNGIVLKVNHQEIHEQPGYHGIQGPYETRWGYTCPTVADWNQDGLPDLLLSGATARHDVFLNTGSRNDPRLSARHPLYFDDLELHGTWRVKPGVAEIEGRMAYILQDDDDALHLYWRVDNFNVEDGGKLTLASNGRPITGYMTGEEYWPGLRGRAKIDISDWDDDGLLDLVVGTVKRGAFPDPESGLPWSRIREGIRSLQVLWLRNVGTNTQPRYEYPSQFQFRGKDITLGSHSNAPVACSLGDTAGGPNLLIGTESGRFYFYVHDDLTFFGESQSNSQE